MTKKKNLLQQYFSQGKHRKPDPVDAATVYAMKLRVAVEQKAQAQQAKKDRRPS